jgi:arabinogalactan oligomer/maltooligosaccharide transport system permease protein
VLGKLSFVLPRLFKYAFLAIVFAILLMLTQSAFAKKEYQISIFLILAMGLIAVTYLSSISIPLKFFAPGVLFLVAFVVIPIVYTVAMSTFKYQTGNYISKEQAIDRIKLLGTAPDENGTTFDVVLGKYNGELAILASDSINKRYFVSTSNNKLELNPIDIGIDENGVAQTS